MFLSGTNNEGVRNMIRTHPSFHLFSFGYLCQPVSPLMNKEGFLLKCYPFLSQYCYCFECIPSCLPPFNVFMQQEKQ